MPDISALHELLLVPGRIDLRAIAGFVADSFDADGALVLLVDDDVDELRVGAAEPACPDAERALRIPVGFGVVGLVALNGHAVTLVDDAPRNADHRRLLGLDGDRTVSRACVPAHGMSGSVVGVVSVHRHEGQPFTEDELHRIQVCADLLGLRLYAQGLLGANEEHHSQRDRLIAQAIGAQEAERRRIAGDLHDGVTQALVSLSFHLSAADRGLSGLPEPDARLRRVADDLAKARRLSDLAYDETRAAIRGLHSLLLEDLGLVAALESLTQNVPQVRVEYRGDDAERIGRVPDHCAAVLYRIAQEALNNVVKHAEARHAVLSLRRVGDAVVLAVTDDGVGFDVRAVRSEAGSATGQRFGLSSIAERCALIDAVLRIDSVASRGTAVIVEAPV